MNLLELEKEKICACIQYQINKLDRKIDKLNELERVQTNKEYYEELNAIKAKIFYENLISKIKRG